MPGLARAGWTCETSGGAELQKLRHEDGLDFGADGHPARATGGVSPLARAHRRFDHLRLWQRRHDAQLRVLSRYRETIYLWRLLLRIRDEYPDAFVLCTVGPLLSGVP